MLITLYIAILALSLAGMRFNSGGWNDGYLSRRQCDAIKGIFILLILIGHANQYINAAGFDYVATHNRPFSLIRSVIGQLVVVMFLFYSGYGVALSCMNKGVAYVRSMPRRRLLTTLLNFDVAVLVFVALQLLLQIPLDWSKAPQWLLAWESVGNSNWYIFIILLCYALSYASMRLPVSNRLRCGVLWALCLVACATLASCKPYYWYNTILVYPAGFTFAFARHRVEPLVRRHYVVVLLAAVVLTAVLFPLCNWGHHMAYNAFSLAFAATLMLITMRVRLGNAALVWLGSCLFPLYIYQRLPMIAIAHACPAFIVHYPILFVTVVLVVTLVIARFYHYWAIKLK